MSRFDIVNWRRKNLNTTKLHVTNLELFRRGTTYITDAIILPLCEEGILGFELLWDMTGVSHTNFKEFVSRFLLIQFKAFIVASG